MLHIYVEKTAHTCYSLLQTRLSVALYSPYLFMVQDEPEQPAEPPKQEAPVEQAPVTPQPQPQAQQVAPQPVAPQPQAMPPQMGMDPYAQPMMGYPMYPQSGYPPQMPYGQPMQPVAEVNVQPATFQQFTGDLAAVTQKENINLI